MPDQVPVVADSNWPSCRMPEIEGSAVLTGSKAPTRLVAADAAETDLRLMELMADRDRAPQPVQNIESANAGTTFATPAADYLGVNRLLEA